MKLIETIVDNWIQIRGFQATILVLHGALGYNEDELESNKYSCLEIDFQYCRNFINDFQLYSIFDKRQIRGHLHTNAASQISDQFNHQFIVINK
jgi:hypothetical protein